MSDVIPTDVPPPPATVTEVAPAARIEVRNQQTGTTVITLGNALELISGVADKILGGEVANSFSGTPMGRGVVEQLALSGIQKNLATQMGV